MSGWSTRACGVAVALATAAGPVQAREPGPAPTLAAPAAREVVVVLPIAAGAGFDQRVARSLDERVAVGLRRGEFTVVAADEVRAQVPAGACAAACLRAVAGATGARYLVRTEVTVEGRDYDVKLVLLRADSGEPVVASAGLCEICGHAELADRVGDLAGELRRKLSSAGEPPPRLRVLTRPHGSEVRLDGVPVGVTPLDITVAAGEHEVMVERPGFVAHRRKLQFGEGATETIAVELGPVAPEDGRAPRRLAAPGWATLAVGLGAAGGGVALFALDERPVRGDCSGANVDAEGDCKYRHNTLVGGVVLTVAGIAAIVVGAALVAIDRTKSQRSRAQARVWMHASGLGLRF